MILTRTWFWTGHLGFQKPNPGFCFDWLSLGWVYFYVLEAEDVVPRPLLSLIMLMRKSSEGNGAAGGRWWWCWPYCSGRSASGFLKSKINGFFINKAQGRVHWVLSSSNLCKDNFALSESIFVIFNNKLIFGRACLWKPPEIKHNNIKIHSKLINENLFSLDANFRDFENHTKQGPSVHSINSVYVLIKHILIH